MKKIAFLIPSTSKDRDWKTLDETYLYKYLLPSIVSVSKDFSIKVFIGYDDDDELYSNIDLPKFYQSCNQPLVDNSFGNFNSVLFEIEWVKFDAESVRGKPTHIWNGLSTLSRKQEYEYMMVLGDDIVCDKRKEWLGIFIKNLKNNNNIGFSAGWSNNDKIPTQFLIHKTHIDIFGFVYPPQIYNWYCDNWMAQVYGKKFGNWLKDYKLLNIGGEPRYTPNNDKRLCDMLVSRHRKKIIKYINKDKYMD